VKSDGGFFIMTGTKGSLPVETESKLESIADGLIDLKLVKRGNSLARFLMVRKVAGRQIRPTEAQFEISNGKGVTFKKLRVRIDALWRK
jgi:KaiC/GvpD/RAD55 family RecA-like ATPase